jgi:DNA invertase Pin-like site-specific DNA recombinase
MTNGRIRKRAAFLVRCSTDKQDYERQVEDLRSVADRFNLSVSEDNIYGEYITGRDDTTKSDRLSIVKLREAAEAREFEFILVAEVSRMSRDSVSGRVYVRQFCNLGIPIYFRDKMKWTINPDTMKEDESFIKELGLYFDGAAEYLKSMKTQIASGRRSSLRNNQLVIGHVPLGYKKRGGKDKKHKSELIIDENQVDPNATKIIIGYEE